MFYLLITSLIWAFSFGLIKDGLSGLPPAAVALIRLAVSAAVFAPFLRIRSLRLPDALRLMLTGALQYGLMYVSYTFAFQYLKAYEVALFTVFTPIYVTGFNDLLERRFSLKTLVAALLAVLGGVVIKYEQTASAELCTGFFLVQGSNLTFAFGQVFYRHTMAHLPQKQNDLQVFGLLYAGAVLTAALAAAGTDWSIIHFSLYQAGILLYLGAVASGIGFFLWNIGARKVSAGTLGIFNNLKIPLGILVAVFCFKETANWPRLLGGGMLMVLAMAVNRIKIRGRAV